MQVVTKQVKANAYGPCATVKANSNLETMKNSDGLAKVFPNPSTGTFKVQLNKVTNPLVNIIILDAKGVVVQHRLLNTKETNTVELNLAGKAKGMYMINIVTDSGTRAHKVMLQ